MLHGGRSGLLADRRQHCIAFVAVGAGGADLDQFVGKQVAFDFRNYGVRQAGPSKEDHRNERMGPGSQFAALCRCDFEHSWRILGEVDLQGKRRLHATYGAWLH